MSEPSKPTDQPDKTAARTQRILRYISELSGAPSLKSTVEGSSSSSRFAACPGSASASDTADVLATLRETVSKSISEVEGLISKVTESAGAYGGWKGDRDRVNAYLSTFRDSVADLEEGGIPRDGPDATELGISLLSYEVSKTAMMLKTLVGHFVEAMKADKKEAEVLRDYLKQLDHMSETI